MSLSDMFSPEECTWLRQHAVTMPERITEWETLRARGAVIYGAGLAGRTMLDELRKKNIFPEWIVDGGRPDGLVDGVPVRGPASLSSVGNRYVLISGVYALDMLRICREAGLDNCIFPYHLPEPIVTLSASYEPIGSVDANDRYVKIYNLFADDMSRKTMKDILAYRITQNSQFLQAYSAEDHYHPKDIKDKFDYSVFCDCGAYNGDTFLSWVQRSDIAHVKYIGIEAGKNNFADLERVTNSFNNINSELYHCALGSRAGRAYFGDGSSGSHFEADGDEVDVMTLDSIIDESITFIKFDIEGSEIYALLGMKNYLEQNSGCTIAISVYHFENDLYKIPFTILKYAPHAKLYLRHHEKTCAESVCYALL